MRLELESGALQRFERAVAMVAADIAALRRWWLRQRAAARTRRELHALSDHLLKDLGLHRSRIDSLYR